MENVLNDLRANAPTILRAMFKNGERLLQPERARQGNRRAGAQVRNRPKMMQDAATIETIWVTDAELIRRSGVPEKTMRQTIQALDGNPRSGFPPKQKMYGDRRHWPSVKAYFERTSGVTIAHQPPERGRRYG